MSYITVEQMPQVSWYMLVSHEATGPICALKCVIVVMRCKIGRRSLPDLGS
jgi:hypothetical protein